MPSRGVGLDPWEELEQPGQGRQGSLAVPPCG